MNNEFKSLVIDLEENGYNQNEILTRLGNIRCKECYGEGEIEREHYFAICPECKGTGIQKQRNRKHDKK